MTGVHPVIVGLLLLHSICSSGQNDTSIYFTRANKTTDSAVNAYYYDKVATDDQDGYSITTFIRKDHKWEQAVETDVKYESDSCLSLFAKSGKGSLTTRYFRKCDNGYRISDFVDNVLTEQGTSGLLFPLIRGGLWRRYDESTGKLLMEGIYKDNQAVTSRYWLNDSAFIDDVFLSVDKEPEYEAGMFSLLKYVSDSTRYPESARKMKITGRVLVGFVVRKDGSVSDLHFVKRVSPDLDSEALRVVSSLPGKWKPGEIENKRVNVVLAIPVIFRLMSGGPASKF
jgi:TonB family protein